MVHLREESKGTLSSDPEGMLLLYLVREDEAREGVGRMSGGEDKGGRGPAGAGDWGG